MDESVLVKSESERDTSNVKTTFASCYMCTMDCPITVKSSDDEIISVSYPKCVRASAMEEQRDSEHRVIKPMLREQSGDSWTTVTWDKAIEQTALKLADIRERHGADSIAFFVGYTKESRPYFQRLAYTFGSPHYIAESSCCYVSAFIASKLTLGKEYASFFNTSKMRQAEAQCRLVWTNNPTESFIPYSRHYLLKDAESLPTIVVDPRRTPLAEAATIHLQLRPGTDGALALGMAHVIFSEGLEDKSFLKNHAHGLAEYQAYVREFTPERTADITGIEATKIIEAAKLYATTKPAQLNVSQKAMTQHSNGFQNHRAVILLAAITGNLDVAGGNRPWLNRLVETNISLRTEKLPNLAPRIGEKEFPVFTDNYDQGQSMPLAENIESGRIKAVVSIGANVMMWPNSKRLEKALKSLELFTVCDFFETPTSDAATAFFPAATHLERQALIVKPAGKVQYRPASVSPRGDAHGDTEFIFAMAEALGLENEFWGGDIAKSYDERLQGIGFKFADLPENGKTIEVDLEKLAERKYEKTGFETPSGKVEFVSTALEDAGYDGLPIYKEPYWSPLGSPDVAKDFPLILNLRWPQ